MEKSKDAGNDPVIGSMFSVGAHYGYTKSRRHPSIKPYIFGVKNHVEIFDLEKTRDLLEEAKEFMRGVGRQGKQVLFVSSKPEAVETVKAAAISIDMPYVAGRWIGGTLTNFSVIRARVQKLLDLTQEREGGELNKYTKKERLLIDREITRLETLFFGLIVMKSMPAVVFVIDSEKEKVAVAEAKKMNVPVVALLGSDCNIDNVSFPIVGNDSASASINFFVKEIITAYREGRSNIEIKPATAVVKTSK